MGSGRISRWRSRSGCRPISRGSPCSSARTCCNLPLPASARQPSSFESSASSPVRHSEAHRLVKCRQAGCRPRKKAPLSDRSAGSSNLRYLSSESRRKRRPLLDAMKKSRDTRKCSGSDHQGTNSKNSHCSYSEGFIAFVVDEYRRLFLREPCLSAHFPNLNKLLTLAGRSH